MNKASVSFGGAILALLLLVAGCASPLANLGRGEASLPALAPGETRLVFSTNGTATESRAIVGDGYLTVQLRSQADGTTKFASATGVAGTYAVTLKGLVAGMWHMKVMLYDNATAQNLLHYGNTSFAVTVGSTNTVPIALYVPGEVDGVNLSEALPANHVTITDPEAGVGPKLLPAGFVWDLDGIAYSSANDTVPATQPAVTWTSSDEDIAWVSSSGRVTVLQPGTVTITARSVENLTLTDTYEIIGAPAVYGDWRWRDPDGDETVFRFGETTFEMYDWSNYGGFDIFRGTYTFVDGVLDFKFEEELNLSTRTWGTITSDMDSYNVFYTRVTPNTIEMMPVLPPMNASVSEGGVGAIYSTLLTRIVEFTETTGVEIGGLPGANDPLTLVVGATIEDYNPIPSPTDATIPRLVWATSNPAVVAYDAAVYGTKRFRAVAPGTATVTGYAATNLTTVVATYNVTVNANLAPTISLATGATQAANVPGAFQVGFSDELELAQIEYELTSTTSSWTDSKTFYPDNTSSYVWNFVTNGILLDGAYVLKVTAKDTQNNTRVVNFNILVGMAAGDSVAPEELESNVYSSYAIGSVYPAYISLTDDLSGIDPASATVSVNQGTASGITASITGVSGGTVYIEIDVYTATVGTGASVTLEVSDYAGNPVIITKTFDTWGGA